MAAKQSSRQPVSYTTLAHQVDRQPPLYRLAWSCASIVSSTKTFLVTKNDSRISLSV